MSYFKNLILSYIILSSSYLILYQYINFAWKLPLNQTLKLGKKRSCGGKICETDNFINISSFPNHQQTIFWWQWKACWGGDKSRGKHSAMDDNHDEDGNERSDDDDDNDLGGDVSGGQGRGGQCNGWLGADCQKWDTDAPHCTVQCTCAENVPHCITALYYSALPKVEHQCTTLHFAENILQ